MRADAGRQAVDQRLDERRRAGDSIRERRDWTVRPAARVDPMQLVQGRVIGKFAHGDMREQRGVGGRARQHLRRGRRDDRLLAALNRLLALWGFVDEGTFLTKAGHVGVAYRVKGIDAEALTHAQRQSFTHRIEAALRSLDEHCRVYQYLVKRTARSFVSPSCAQRVAHEAIQRRTAYLNSRRAELYDLAAYVVLMYEPPTPARNGIGLGAFCRSPREVLARGFSRSRTIALVESELDRALGTLHHKAGAFEAQLGDFAPRRLSRQEAFRFLRDLVNYDPAVADAAPGAPDSYLDYFLADSPVECHRDHLLVGRRWVKLLSMKEPPAQTFAHVLADLYAVPGEFIACLEWQRVPSDRMRRDIQTRRRHFFNKRVSIVNYISPDTRPEEMLVDDSASATVRQLGDALTEMEVNGHVFGTCSLTLVLHGLDTRALDHQAAEAMKALAVHDGSFFEESYNLLNAWLAIIPGNRGHNLRRVALLETNVADLSLLFTFDQGDPISSHLRREALAIFETPHATPYSFNLHVQDVGHTLVLGATGSGKSFLLNFLITHGRKYEPLTVVLDLGHSYRKLAALLDGRYVELGLKQVDVTINPFAQEPTPERLHFLHAFVRVLLEGSDSYRLSDLEDREVYEAVVVHH